MHRFKEGFVGRCEEERCSEECQNHNPAHPCERKHGGENTAARVIPACGEVAPVCPRVRGIPSVSGNAGTNNPEEEEDEESNNLTPEEVDVAVFQPRVNRAGYERRPEEREDTGDEDFHDNRVVELNAIVQGVVRL